VAITIGCCYCSKLLLYSYGPPVTFTFAACDADWVNEFDCVAAFDCVDEAVCDWSTEEELPAALASWFWFWFAVLAWFAVLDWFADWSIDCATFADCANACCGCGIAPTPIKDIADSSSVAVANIASVGHFRFFSPEFPVERRFIVEVHTLMVNMKYGLVFSIKIQNLEPNFIVMKK
jgi:hypothetical protein